MPGDDVADDKPRLPVKENNQKNVAATRLAEEARANPYRPAAKVVKDVTESFTAVSHQLRPGHLIQDEAFTLFGAVGALEMMDAKMDSGFVADGDSLDPDFDPARSLDAVEVIWIMDELMSLEIAWHDGSPLSQTLFTSLHLDRVLAPETPYPYPLSASVQPGGDSEDGLIHRVLRAYCLAIAKCCDLAIRAITSQNYYEEEDFVTHLFGRDLAPKLGVNETISLLKEATTWLVHAEIPLDIRRAIGARLGFRAELLLAMQLLDNALETWKQTLKSLVQVQESHHLGSPLPEAFSSKVQRHLATSTPPRPKLEISWSDASAKWTRLLNDVVEAHRLTSFGVWHSPNGLQRATWAFASRRPMTYPGSVLQHLLFADGKVAGKVSHYDLLLMDLGDLVLAGDPLAHPRSFQIEVPTDPRHRASRKMEEFMDHVFEEYINLYRMVCQNRCRIRRTFTQAIPLLDNLQQEAEKTDHDLHEIMLGEVSMEDGIVHQPAAGPLTSWIYYHKLQIMEWTIQLGFETDIYLPHEIPSMSGFLAELASERHVLLEQIETSLLNRMKRLAKERSRAAALLCCASQDFLKSLMGLADVTVALAEALRQLYVLLLDLNLIKRPSTPYARPQLLYEARMKPYLTLVNGPAIPGVEEMQAFSTLNEPVDTACVSIDVDLLKPAKACLGVLKNVTPEQGKYTSTEDDWKRHIKALETSIVATGVAVTQLKLACRKRGITHCGDLSDSFAVVLPPPGKRYHDWWVVPQLKQKK